jgi:hypothetical protein
VNEQQLRAILARNPAITANDPAGRQVRDPEPKRDPETALDEMEEGEAEGNKRIGIRFVGYRCKLLDPDNFAGSTKDLIDGLRKFGAITEDTPDKITLETEQVRVRKRKEERTEIVITYPE